PDPVAEPVAELLAQAGRGDHVARRRIRLLRLDAGPRRLETLELRLEADVVGALELVRKLAGGERARAVRAVPVEHCSRIDHDRRPPLDHTVAAVGVRPSAVRPGGDDGVESLLLGSELVEVLEHPPGELALGTADEPLL